MFSVVCVCQQKSHVTIIHDAFDLIVLDPIPGHAPYHPCAGPQTYDLNVQGPSNPLSLGMKPHCFGQWAWDISVEGPLPVLTSDGY